MSMAQPTVYFLCPLAGGQVIDLLAKVLSTCKLSQVQTQVPGPRSTQPKIQHGVEILLWYTVGVLVCYLFLVWKWPTQLQCWHWNQACFP